MTPICRTFGRPLEDLDAFLERVQKGYDPFGWLSDEHDGFGVGTPGAEHQSGRPSVGAGLRSYGGDTNRPVEIAVMVYWDR